MCASRVIRESWFSRLRGSLRGLFTGLLIFLASFVLLVWNEHHAVREYKTLRGFGGKAREVSANSVDPANEGKPVCVTGRAGTDELLRDEAFGISVNAIKYRRTVDMFQWEERLQNRTRTLAGGSTETYQEPAYQGVWSSRLIDSRSFQQAEKHRNPSRIPYGPYSERARTVRLGSFELDRAIDLNYWDPLSPKTADALPEGAVIADQAVFLGSGTPEQPAIGDLRIQFSIVPPDLVTVLATQREQTLMRYTDARGHDLALEVKRGRHSLADMLASAEKRVRSFTWILRLLGWGLMILGLSTVFRPLGVLADVLPPLGQLLRAGTGFLAAALATILTLCTVALSWIAVRPGLALPLLVLALALAAWTGKRRPPLPTKTA